MFLSINFESYGTYALRPKKPGFLPHLGAATHLFVKNPVSRPPCVSPIILKLTTNFFSVSQDIVDGNPLPYKNHQQV
jgi:hypothetical protein